VEMPDAQADRVIRSLQQNEGALSNVLAREIPILAEPGVWAEVVEAVSAAWQGDAAPS
jgi:putative filamentation induced by cAMP protein fic